MNVLLLHSIHRRTLGLHGNVLSNPHSVTEPPATGPRPVQDRCQFITRDEASAREDAPVRISILAPIYRGFVWFGGEYAHMASVNNKGRSGSSRPAAQLVIGTPARVLFSLTLIAGLLAVVLNAALAQDQTTDLTGPEGTPVATPSASMPGIEVQLEEVNESDLGGTVSLYDNGDSTIVEFAVTGAGGDHPAVIIPGVCGETANDPVAELEDVDNRGESTTVIDTSLDDLLAEDHAIEVRMSADDSDTVIACAVIAGDPLVDPVATPESSPEVTVEATPDASADEDNEDLEGVGGNTSNVNETSGGETPDAETDAAGTLTVNLVDWSDTGVSGTAELTENGSITQVVVTIDGPGVIGDHELHIHNGTCTTPGSATYTLNPIDANGSSSSSINLTLDQLTGGNYFINVHPDEENWDDWMVCGNITGTPNTVGAAEPTAVPNQVSDGSVGGNTTMVTTNAQAGEFPTTVGVGDALRWPSDARTAAIWAVSAIAITALASGLILRFGERSGSQSRLGL